MDEFISLYMVAVTNQHIPHLLECNSEGQLISTGPSSSTDAYDIARNYEIGTRTIDFLILSATPAKMLLVLRLVHTEADIIHHGTVLEHSQESPS